MCYINENEALNQLADTIKDVKTFAETFLQIRSKENCLKQFILNKEQNYINGILNQQKQAKGAVRSLILKGRQIGVSTYISARAYHYTLVNQGVRSLILSHRQSSTNNIFAMVNRYYHKMPDFLKIPHFQNRNKSITFAETDSSLVFATAGSNEVGRSDTIQFFHGSEVAFWANSQNHLASILMAVPNGNETEVILESTSNGANGLFYEMCMQAQESTSEYSLIFIPWHWHKEYVSNHQVEFSTEWQDYGKVHQLSCQQLAWAYEKNKLLGGLESVNAPSFRFYQEFPASIAEAFTYINNNIFIPLELLQRQAVNSVGIQKDTTLLQQYLASKEEPIILGIDVALGGGDYTWLIDRQGSFIGLNANQQVSLTDSMQIVGLVKKYIDKLKPKYVCIDAGGGGVGVYDRLVELGYQKIMVLVNFASKATDTRKYLNKRAEMWGLLQEFLQDDNYIIHDNKLLQQIAAVEYFYNSKGQIQLQAKENVRKTLKSSPDGADATALTFALPAVVNIKINSVVAPSDYNPFTW